MSRQSAARRWRDSSAHSHTLAYKLYGAGAPQNAGQIVRFLLCTALEYHKESPFRRANCTAKRWALQSLPFWVRQIRSSFRIAWPFGPKRASRDRIIRLRKSKSYIRLPYSFLQGCHGGHSINVQFLFRQNDTSFALPCLRWSIFNDAPYLSRKLRWRSV